LTRDRGGRPSRARELVDQAGAGFADAVKLTIFVRDFAYYTTLVHVREECFPAEGPPASTRSPSSVSSILGC